jgi:hypothetical protein
MRTVRSLALAAVTPLLAVSALAGTAATASAEPGGRPLTTAMTGAQEAPNPGDPDATGTAMFTLNQGQGVICFDLSWADVDGTVVAAHIHEAPAGEPGGIVVPLFSGSYEGTDGEAGCVSADPALVKAIRKDPAAYYVNVHSSPDYPGGAVRGQLG